MGLALAAGSAAILHVLAVHLSIPMSTPEAVSIAQSPDGLGSLNAQALYGRSFIGTLATLFQFIIPLGLLFAAFASFRKRSQARALLTQAQSAPETAVSSMTWAQFERLIGESFRRRGYQVTETGRAGSDGGVDLLVTQDGNSFPVQCKHWRTRRVGVATIRELNGIIAARHAAGGFVVTSGRFTPDARHFAQSCRIELIDGERLSALFREIESRPPDPGTSPAEGQATATPLTVEINTCPKCGCSMTRRTATRGQYRGQDFLGCTRYPSCSGVRRA